MPLGARLPEWTLAKLIGTSRSPVRVALDRLVEPALSARARSETDEVKRKALYGDMQELVSDKGGIGIPAFMSLLDAYDNRLHGLDSIPTGPMMGYSFAETTWWSA